MLVTEQMRDEVVRRLSDPVFCRGRWEAPYAEIQDDWEYLFVSVSSPHFEPHSVSVEVKADIARFLAPRTCRLFVMQPQWGAAEEKR